MKGIILAGGRATRLHPLTITVSKQLLPVYDKPMIYYPLSVLMLAGIQEILIISTPETLPLLKGLLGDGSSLGISISYKIQEQPRGLADAFILGEQFIGNDSVCLILGDNLFYGQNLSQILTKAANVNSGATIFGYYVSDPENYGVVQFDSSGRAISIEEKPKRPVSNWAVPGLYFYDNRVIDIAKALKPSKRGELEITDINSTYLNLQELNVLQLGRGFAWLDTGTHESLLDAGMFIKTIETRQGLKVGAIEEVAYRMGFITSEQLHHIGKNLTSKYGEYLKALSMEKFERVN